jgi:hypothetical protein
MHIAIVKQKLPAIEQAILGRATALFEQEVNDLRPEDAKQCGRDRRYIRKYLGQLFEKNSPQNWERFHEKNMPYITTLIDHMLVNRKLNDRAQLTLKRAKQDSVFHEEGLAKNVIAVCVKVHLVGVAEPLRTQIADTIEEQRGPRYYAIHAAHQWMHEDQEEDSDDDQEDDDDDEDDDDNDDGIRSSKRVRIAKDQNKGPKKK